MENKIVKIKVSDKRKKQQYLEISSKGLTPKFTSTEMELIRSSIDESEIEDMEDIKKIRSKIGTDRFILAKLFLECYDKMQGVSYSIKEGSVKIELSDYLEYFDNSKLRDLIEDYDGGSGIGDYYTKEKIKDFVADNRKKMNDLITLFFEIFGEEDF